MRFRFTHPMLVLAVAIALLCPWPTSGSAAAGEVIELINDRTPWRAHAVLGPHIYPRDDGQLQLQRRHDSAQIDPTARDAHEVELGRGGRGGRAFTPVAPRDWFGSDFDDFHWPIYRQDDLFDFIGDHGSGVGRVVGGGDWTWLAGVNLRTRFGISDPDAVDRLELTVRLIGGAVVYVNGEEVGRGYIPEGDVHPLTPLAEVYPREAYVDEDGETLPGLSLTDRPEEQWQDRYDLRFRSFTVEIPAHVLRRGANVLAIDVRRAPLLEGGFRGRGRWEHAGFQGASLSSPGAEGVIAYDERVKGTHLWTAQPSQQVADTPSEESLIRRGWHWSMYWARGLPVRGVDMANPFDPLQPIRMAIPRNGVGSGQAVLSDLEGLRNVRAELAGDLRGPRGARLPAAAVDIRYAVQPDGLHYADTLLAEPPEEARAVPVWLLVEVPAGQRPGWYTGELNLQANGERFSAPVQVLVTGYELPSPRDFRDSRISLEQCPKNVAVQYEVEPWSDEHWALLERSMRLLGQVGSDVVTVPVILSDFRVAGRPHPPGRSDDESSWRLPLVRFVQGDGGLEPDLSLLERYLDLFVKHAGDPRAISLWIWDPSSAPELARAYERGVREHSVDQEPREPVLVEVWNPDSGAVEQRRGPHLLHENAEAFWKPLLDAVHKLVTDRGWDEDIIMLGLGSDVRAGERTGERLRQWAPHARWELLSHFSGETPGRVEDGRFLATGQLEVGIRRWPWWSFRRTFNAQRLEESLEDGTPELMLPTARWQHQPWSPPHLYRTLATMWGHLGRIGLDFWKAGDGGPSNSTFFSHVQALAAPGPDGAAPTVRFQMLRQSVQDHELRMAIVRGYLELAEDEREPYQDLLDELGRRMGWSTTYLSQHELSYDWPSYAAQLQQAAAELAGEQTDARWQQPPR